MTDSNVPRTGAVLSDALKYQTSVEFGETHIIWVKIDCIVLTSGIVVYWCELLVNQNTGQIG